jgi:methylphosphotriester-DNA--protein-cysteine methyltransferase
MQARLSPDQYGLGVFEYVSRAAGGETGRFVESIWFARGRMAGARERIAPTGSTVAAVVLGDPIRQTPAGAGTPLVTATGFLIGPHDRPIVNEPQGETYCVGIVTTPVGCRPALGLAPATLRGRIADLLATWPRAATLRDALTTCRTPAEALDLVEETLRTPEPFDHNAFARCADAVRQLAEDPARPVAEIAATLGVTHGHLDRLFAGQVGLSPRTLARILRMRRLLAGIDVHGLVGWAAQAAALGWYDQAHLIRDFKRHTGVTPSAYVAAQRSTYDRAEAAASAGFVPEMG